MHTPAPDRKSPMSVYSIVRIPPGNFLNNRIQNSENIRIANQRYGPGSDASALIPPDGKIKYRPDFLYCPAQDSTLNVTCDVLTNLVCNLYVFLPHQIHPHAVQHKSQHFPDEAKQRQRKPLSYLQKKG